MSLFSYIKTQLSILDVVSEYAKLKKAGVYWKGSCPFHNEKTASFTVSPHKEIFYCFGCHNGGDVITFMSKVENCTPIEAAKHLIDRYKLTIPESLTAEANISTSQEKNRYYDLCKMVAQWCHTNLVQNPSVGGYLKNRGISKASIDYFSIGYFPGGLNAIKACLAFMRTHNFLPDDLIQSHILAQGKTVLYSPFEERIIFPIKDHLGRFCGFGGRIFKADDTRAKYYNSRENEHFTKGSLLFGLDLAKKDIQQAESAFFVEGYTDCVTMVQHGYKNTVATLGTACTHEHLKALSRYAQKLIVLYDGDRAGQDAILRLTELCWQVSLDLTVIKLPPQEDPASFLAKGNDLKPLVATATDIFEFFIQSLGSDFSNKSLSEKMALVKKITGIIQKIDDPLKRDILLQKAARTLDLPIESIKNELRKTPKEQFITPVATPVLAKTGVVEPPPAGNADKLEKKIFFAIMNNMQLFSEENEEYLVTYLPSPLREILHQLQQAKNVTPALDFIQFFDILSESDQSYVSKLLLEFEEVSYIKDFEHLVLQLQKQNWKTIVHAIKTKLAHARAQGDEDKVARILHDFLELKQKMVHKDLI